MIKTPEFWANRGPVAIALSPISLLWAAGSYLQRLISKPVKAALPIICVGNLTAGGTGKTPVTAFIYDQLTKLGYRPAILMRGYGGSAKQPVWVDHSHNQANLCGDEAVMLAESRDVMVARDRLMGAAIIAASGSYDVILMDDGLQNPHIAKDFKIAIFDGSFGIGNGMLIPAGPMRIGFKTGIDDLDAVIINGPDITGIGAKLPLGLPQFSGRLRPDRDLIDSYGGAPLLGFAGIGRPKRFFETLVKTGANLVHQLAFADHHPYSENDLVRLQEDASRYGAELITTHKDWVRLPVEWRNRVGFLPVTLDLDYADEFVGQIDKSIAGRKEQHL